MRRRRLTTGHAFVDLGLAMGLFGLLVGAVFPFAVVALGVARPQDAFTPLFQSVCLVAGLVVGVANLLLARAVVGARLRRLNCSMVATGRTLRGLASGGLTTEALRRHGLPVDSRDEFGAMAGTYNELLGSLERSWTVQRCLRAVSHVAGEVWSSQTQAPEVVGRLLRVLLDEHGGLSSARWNAPDGAVVEFFAGDLTGDSARDERSVAQALAGGRGTLVVSAGARHIEELPDLVLGVADTMASALARAELQTTVQRQASTDELTGLLNRREGLERMRQAVLDPDPEVSDPDGLGILIIDLDHFKQINDTHGHLAGDEVLRGVGALCRNVFRRSDVVCRYGGEEILVLLTGVDEHTLLEAAERLRAAVADEEFVVGERTVRVSASVGARWCVRSEFGDLTELVAEADAALYAAKAAGRDRVVLHAAPTPV